MRIPCTGGYLPRLRLSSCRGHRPQSCELSRWCRGGGPTRSQRQPRPPRTRCAAFGLFFGVFFVGSSLGSPEVVVDLKTAITLKPEARTKWLSKAEHSGDSVLFCPRSLEACAMAEMRPAQWWNRARLSQQIFMTSSRTAALQQWSVVETS